MQRRSLIAIALFVAASDAPAQVSPEKADATFRVAPGLEFKLWASEPLFCNPTAIDIDPAGRVWVCEAVNYRQILRGKSVLRPEGDRILILEDSKGQGRADKVTVFAQAPYIQAPLGIAVLKDPSGPGIKVYVAQSPDILIFEDRDGDGKADGPPKKLLSGFGGIDHDHGVHGLSFGPDGKLYFSVGDQGVKDLQSTDGKGRKWTTNNTDCKAGTCWRCDPDGTQLELIAHNFRNHYKLAVDSFGTIFTSDNDDDGNQQTRVCYVMPGGDYGYWPRGKGESHWHEESPGVVPKVLRTYFGSPTGNCFYEGTLLPAKYRGQLFGCDAGPREVRCYHIKPKGAGYELDQEVVVSSTDNWFRPSDICIAPDGSAFVSDWYDPGVGGHGMGDTTRGRIYRLGVKGPTAQSIANLNLATATGALDALKSPSSATRIMAWQLVHQWQKDSLTQLLQFSIGMKGQFQVAKPSDNSVVVARLAYLLADLIETTSDSSTFMVLCGCDEEYRKIFELDNDRRFALQFLKIMMQFIPSRKLPQNAKEDQMDVAFDKVRFARDASSFFSMPMRREYLISSVRNNPTRLKDIVSTLCNYYDGQDPFYLAALGIAVGADSKRREIILEDFEKHFPDWNDRVAKLVWELRPPKMMPKLADRLKDSKLPPQQRAQIVDILAGWDGPNVAQQLLAQLVIEESPAVRERLLAVLVMHIPGKWKALQKSPELQAAIDNMLGDDAALMSGLALIAAAEDTAAIPRLLVIAQDRGAAQFKRQAAVLALGALADASAVTALEKLLSDRAVSQRVGDALARHVELRRGTQNAALKILQRAMAVSALLQTRAGSQWLLEQAAAKKLPEQYRAEVGRALRGSPYADLRNKALVLFPIPAKLDTTKLDPRTLAQRTGDAASGERLMRESLIGELQCLKCHAVRGAGGAIGPDLSQIGVKASKENLFESILQPHKAIADQFVQWQIVTSNGATILGLLISENERQLTLRDATGRDHVIPVNELESKRKTTTSLMPDNLVNTISAMELTDLVEYLTTLREVNLGPARWEANGTTLTANAQGLIEFGPAIVVAGKINAPADQDARIVFSSSVGVVIEVNGVPVRTVGRSRLAIPWQETIPVRLVKGDNVVRLRFDVGSTRTFWCAVLADAPPSVKP